MAFVNIVEATEYTADALHPVSGPGAAKRELEFVRPVGGDRRG